MSSSKLVATSLLGAATLLFASCSSSNHVDLQESKRFLGRDNDVRVDAQIFSDQIDNSSFLRVVYEVENFRSMPIALADGNAETDYDPSTQTITLNIGSEIPGSEVVPRLSRIESGERRGFSIGARFNILALSTTGPFARHPRYLRVKLHFLGDVTPFETLLSLPERGAHDPKLADRLFPVWIEKNQTVVTNALPIYWRGDAPSVATGFDGSF